MAEFEFKERIAKPHAYAPCPSDLQLLAKCGRSSGVCDESHNCMQEGVRKQKCSDSGVSERGLRSAIYLPGPTGQLPVERKFIYCN